MRNRSAIIRCYILIIIATLVICVPETASPKPTVRKPAKSRNSIAVVRSKYDDVDLVLNNFRIRHDLLTYRDLEYPERVAGYRSLFVPSGIDNPIEEMVDVRANNFRFKSVALKPDFYEVDRDKVARTLRRFVRNGGSAYFSGYSFEYLQKAFGLMEFFDNFPYMGLPARLEADVYNDLSRFSRKNRIALYMDHPGWIAVKSASGAEVIAKAAYDTPRGVRSGPVSFLSRRGSGELLYTSYDSTVFSAFRRFNIYRIAGAHLIQKFEDEASRWGQSVTGRIVNAVHAGENEAVHRIDLVKGNNTIYFYSEREIFQIDVVDRGYSLIESRDIPDRDQTFTVRADRDDRCYIKIYPSTNDRFGMYTVVSASGRRIVPYFYHVLIVLGSLAAATAALFIFRIVPGGGYRGRWRG
jgi:hypothetical protein